MHLTLNSNSDSTVSDPNAIVEEIHDFGNLIKISYFSYPILVVITNEINIFNVDNKMILSDNICNIKAIYSFGQ